MELLKDIYIQELNETCLHLAITNVCNRCITNHPSQRQQNICLIMPRKQQIDLVLDDAITLIDETCVQSNLEYVWNETCENVVSDPVKFLLLNKDIWVILKQCQRWKNVLRHSLI